MPELDVEPEARRRIEAFVAYAASRAGAGPEQTERRMELYSHVYELAAARAQRRGSTVVEARDVDLALDKLSMKDADAFFAERKTVPPSPSADSDVAFKVRIPPPPPLSRGLAWSMGLVALAAVLQIGYFAFGVPTDTCNQPVGNEPITCGSVELPWSFFVWMGLPWLVAVAGSRYGRPEFPGLVAIASVAIGLAFGTNESGPMAAPIIATGLLALVGAFLAYRKGGHPKGDGGGFSFLRTLITSALALMIFAWGLWQWIERGEAWAVVLIALALADIPLLFLRKVRWPWKARAATANRNP